MKYWTEVNGDIEMRGADGGLSDILSIGPSGVFMQFTGVRDEIAMYPDEAIELLEEAINWIHANR